MKNVLEDHPRIATVAAVAIATGVVLLLYFLSTRPATDTGSSRPVSAHSNEGPVVIGGPGPDAAGEAYLESVTEADFEREYSAETAAGDTIENIIFVDVDSDGAQEAVVLVRGGGESRPLHWSLYGIRDGRLAVLYDRNNIAQGELQVDGPRLVESEGIFAQEDEPCCPSSFKKTYYTWKEDALVVSRVESAPPGV